MQCTLPDAAGSIGHSLCPFTSLLAVVNSKATLCASLATLSSLTWPDQSLRPSLRPSSIGRAGTAFSLLEPTHWFMMSHLIPPLLELRALPPLVHLLCPRHNEDDQDRYDDDILGGSLPEPIDADRKSNILAARERREKFISCLQLLAYDGEETEKYQRMIWDTLDTTLGKCDICIRNYYVEKLKFLAKLREEYEEPDVQQFFGLIDRRDIARITKGLEAVENVLTALPEAKRGTSALKPAELHALFEALLCDAFLRNEDLVAKYFDEPFRLIQTKKQLKIREIFPSTVRFLFSTNHRRLSWATATWVRLDREPTELEWTWSIKDTLQERLQKAVDPASISRFWSGTLVVVKTLSSGLVRDKLLDLQPNLSMAALDHLHQPTSAVPFITQTLGLVIAKAPKAFWQTMGTISAPTIIEQVLNSPKFAACLNNSADPEVKAELDVLEWAPNLVQSLDLANQPAVCDALSSQLFKLMRPSDVPQSTKKLCFQTIAKTILQTTLDFTEDAKENTPVERIVTLELLKVITTHSSDLLNPQQLGLTGDSQKTARRPVLAIVRNAIALDCQVLKNDFAALNAGQSPKHTPNCFTQSLWDAVVRAMDNTDSALSVEVLQGTMALPGLQKFRVRNGDNLSKQKEVYNTTFDLIHGAFARMLGKLADFDPEHLDTLYKQVTTNMYLVAALFSADDNTYQAAVELIKHISAQGSRKDALAHLVDAFFSTTIYSFSWVFRRIANMRTFASIPRLVMYGMEILDVLCNSNDGKLRRNHTSDIRDFDPVSQFWSYQWIALQTIFEKMETWSQEVHDKPLMTEVCRDTMQYAEALFEQYHTFASFLTTSKPAAQNEIPKRLLDSSGQKHGSPLKVLSAMAKWLRLRDKFLAEKLAELIKNMLIQLQQHQVSGEFEGIKYVRDIATTSSIRTILTETQKADLVRALEQYTGEQISKPVKKKQLKLQLEQWATSAADARKGLAVKTESADEFDEVSESDWRQLMKNSTAVKREASKLGPSRIAPIKPPQPNSSDAASAKAAARREVERTAFIADRKREQELRKQRDRDAAAKARGVSTLGEGIGFLGKDHAKSVESNMMVSSDSESDSDDDDLFGKVPNARIKQTLATRDRKSDVAGPVRKIKVVRSQKDMRARLAPDLSSLHKTILAWDFFADTDLPPNSSKSDYTLVTNAFESVQDYQKTFEPLLILEGWQSFRAAREDGTFKAFELKIANSLLVDSFFEVNVRMSFQQGKELGWGATDVILLSKSTRPHIDSSEPHCLARVKEVSRKKGEVHIVFRINSAGNPLRPFLNDNADVWGTQILSLTTLEREYGALMALPYYDLSEEVISAKPSRLMNYSEREVAPIVKAYDVNEAQAKAVKSALDNDAFTLIQGPPGSGKTKTICALVGAAMTGHLPKQQTKGPRLNTANGAASVPKAAKRILVCAPSNAAVDELVMRFKAGLKLMDGSTEKINVVRLGRSDAINTNVKDVTLDELVNAKLNVGPKDQKEDIHAVMMEHKKISAEVIELRDSISARRQKGESVPATDENTADQLKRRKTELSNKIDKLREDGLTESRNADLNRKRVQQEILDGAHILCATLSGSGHEIFQGLNVEFETVVIDEAAQSIELSALIPLKYGCTKCILVGDPKQLPPTVLSREAARFQYEQSLFARMEKNDKKNIHLLDTQYRMHPEISLYPSRTFYDSMLKDGAGMAKLRARPWHHSSVLAPYRFFDVQGMSQSSKGHSLINMAEIEIAMALYDRLVTDVKKYTFRGKVGIITPYKGQLRELKMRFRSRYGEEILSAIEFNTTDAFQGRESEIIIFSCVRASTKGIGFLNDVRRMNVGLTRAKSSLWVLGNSAALNQGEFWRGLISDSKSRNLYTDGNIKALLSRPLLTEDMMKDDISMTEEEPPPLPVVAEAGSASSTPSLANATAALKRPPDEMSRKSSTSSATSAAQVRPDHQSKPVMKSVAKPVARADITSTHVSEPRGSDAVYGPSGGRFGLNDLVKCRICGSDQHFSFNCDDVNAHEAQMGKCKRCYRAGHSMSSCTEPRCLECGEVGHQKEQCTAPARMRLTKDQQTAVIAQEARYKKQREKDLVKRAARQLGDHDTKIPEVKSSIVAPTEPKRKRDDEAAHGACGSGISKAPRTTGGYAGAGPSWPLVGGEGGQQRPNNKNRTAPPPAPAVARRKKPNANDIFMKRR